MKDEDVTIIQVYVYQNEIRYPITPPIHISAKLQMGSTSLPLSISISQFCQGLAIVGRGGGGSGCCSVGGGALSQWTHPHWMSVQRDRCIACNTTATLAAHSDTNIPSSVGVQFIVVCV